MYRNHDQSFAQAVDKYSHHILTSFALWTVLEINTYILPGVLRDWQRVKKAGLLVSGYVGLTSGMAVHIVLVGIFTLIRPIVLRLQELAELSSSGVT